MDSAFAELASARWMNRLDARSMSLAVRLVLLAVAIEFCISAKLLTWAGIPYSTEGGAFPLKIHPGTYVLLFAFLAHCAAQRRPNGVFSAIIGRDKFLAVFLGSILVCLFYALLTTGRSNVIVLIDSFLPAGLLVAILRAGSERDLGALRQLMQWGVAMNAVLALGEAAAHESLVPLYLDHGEYRESLEEFRPTALYDHPLTGGVMTMIGFALTPKRLCFRVPYTLLLMGSMLAFGGRVSVAAVLISWLVIAGVSLARFVLKRDQRALHLLISIFFIFFAGTPLIAAAFYAGLGTRLAGHLYWDPSAQVRLAQWHLLGEMNSSQLIFGVERKDLLDLLNPLRLTYGVQVIENFWLLMFASLGLAGFSIFLAGFLSLLTWCWKCSGLRGRVLLVAVIIVASTSNSLGRKSTLLVGLVAAISSMSVRPVTLSRQVWTGARHGQGSGALVSAS
jgi:hypothetical protein